MSAYSTLILGTPGLAGYWQLDDTVGSGTAADSQGSTTLAATSVTFGSPPVISTGTSASFNGATSILANASTTPIPTLANTSLEAWVKWTPGSQQEQSIVRNGNPSGGNAFALVVNGNATTSHHLWLLRESIGWDDFGYVLDGNPHHLVVVVTSGPTFSLYVDGGFISQVASSTNTPSGGFSIGGQVGARFFNGIIDEVAAYSVALPTATIAAHYEAGAINLFGKWNSGFVSHPSGQFVNSRWRSGLLAAHVMQGYGLKALDSLGNFPATLVVGNSWGTGEFGSELQYTGTSAQLPATGLNVKGQAAFTVAVLAKSTSMTQSNGISGERYLSTQRTSSVDYLLEYVTTAQTINFTVGSAGISAGAPYVLHYNLYVARFVAGVMDLYYNGYKVATGSSGPGVVPSNTSDIYIGTVGVSGTGPLQWNGSIAAHYLWSRGLTDTEIAALSADPFAPVRPAPSRLSVLAGATAPPPTAASPFLLAHF